MVNNFVYFIFVILFLASRAPGLEVKELTYQGKGSKGRDNGSKQNGRNNDILKLKERRYCHPANIVFSHT